MATPRYGIPGSRSAPAGLVLDNCGPLPSLPQLKVQKPVSPPQTKTVRFREDTKLPATDHPSTNNLRASSAPQLNGLRKVKGYRNLPNVTSLADVSTLDPALNPYVPKNISCKYNKSFLLQFQTVFTDEPSEDWANKIENLVATSTSELDTIDAGAATDGLQYLPGYLGQFEAVYADAPSRKWHKKVEKLFAEGEKMQTPVQNTRARSGVVSGRNGTDYRSTSLESKSSEKLNDKDGNLLGNGNEVGAAAQRYRARSGAISSGSGLQDYRRASWESRPSDKLIEKPRKLSGSGKEEHSYGVCHTRSGSGTVGGRKDYRRISWENARALETAEGDNSGVVFDKIGRKDYKRMSWERQDKGKDRDEGI